MEKFKNYLSQTKRDIIKSFNYEEYCPAGFSVPTNLLAKILIFIVFSLIYALVVGFFISIGMLFVAIINNNIHYIPFI